MLTLKEFLPNEIIVSVGTGTFEASPKLLGHRGSNQLIQ